MLSIMDCSSKIRATINHFLSRNYLYERTQLILSSRE
nr:MAG TPA: hypothetical protein [Caudoviricetes sp.]DAT42821.1 MAG TPA: hypothetical protein [Caudoviricetes sp.]